MTDEQKDKLIAKLISTKEGREKIIQIAKEAATMDKLGEAINECFENFAK
jgi:hypothetical protein